MIARFLPHGRLTLAHGARPGEHVPWPVAGRFFEQKTHKNSSKKPAPGPPTPRGGCMCAFCIEIATMIASFRPLGRLPCGFRAQCPHALTRPELFHTIAGRRFAFSRGRPSPAAMAKCRPRQTARQAGGCWLGVLKGALSDGSVSGSFCPRVPKITFYRCPLLALMRHS